MKISFSWWGQELYYLDGQLLEKRWNLAFAGARDFRIGGHLVRIEVSVGPKEYYTRVYLDGKLHVEELFPETRAKVEKWKRSPLRYVIIVPLAILFTLVGLWLIGPVVRWLLGQFVG
jgi:hypothetical protein